MQEGERRGGQCPARCREGIGAHRDGHGGFLSLPGGKEGTLHLQGGEGRRPGSCGWACRGCAQPHRLVDDLQRSSCPAPQLKQGHLLQCPVTLPVKKGFLMVRRSACRHLLATLHRTQPAAQETSRRRLCGKARLVAHVRFSAHQDPQGLFCKAAFLMRLLSAQLPSLIASPGPGCVPTFWSSPLSPPPAKTTFLSSPCHPTTFVDFTFPFTP